MARNARKATKAEKAEALEALRKHMKPGTTIYIVLRHRARSGMYRVLDVFTFDGGEPLRWSWSVAVALGWRYDDKHEGIGVSGCGMDMGFHLVNTLSYALHGYDSHDAGYSLTHRWL